MLTGSWKVEGCLVPSRPRDSNQRRLNSWLARGAGSNGKERKRFFLFFSFPSLPALALLTSYQLLPSCWQSPNRANKEKPEEEAALYIGEIWNQYVAMVTKIVSLWSTLNLTAKNQTIPDAKWLRYPCLSCLIKIWLSVHAWHHLLGNWHILKTLTYLWNKKRYLKIVNSVFRLDAWKRLTLHEEALKNEVILFQF